MHTTIRYGLVLTTVPAVAPPAFAAAAEDVGIELPAVPAAVMGGARFVKVAATTEGSSGTDRVLELGPKTVTVEPGTTAIVEVAINELNRIVTPFAAPQVRTVSAATTQVDGGGLSKSVGLPQLKLAWTAVSGPVALVDAALAHLEVSYDAYLSVSTPVQLALGRLLAERVTVRDAILGRVRRNLDALRTSASRHEAVSVLRVEGGWSAVVQVPAILPEEELALRLLEQHDLIVHPAYFFDFTRGAFVVASLLPAPRSFDEAISRLLRAVDEL